MSVMINPPKKNMKKDIRQSVREYSSSCDNRGVTSPAVIRNDNDIGSRHYEGGWKADSLLAAESGSILRETRRK